jgi:hydrogenase 3 maturation protease
MSVLEELREILTQRTSIVGMGNYYRNDDAAGLLVVDGVKDEITAGNITVYNVEDVLESYIFKIAGTKPANVLLIDAVETDCDPGEIIFTEVDCSTGMTNDMSTHKLSLALSAKILKEMGIRTCLLGITAENTDFGREMNKDVKESVNSIKEFIINNTNVREKEFFNVHGSL